MKKYLALLLLIPSVVFGQPSGAAPGTNTALYTTAATIAFGDIDAAYTVELTNTKPLRFLDVVNKSDCDVWISFDGTTDHFIIPVSTALSLNYQEMMKYEGHSVYMKFDAAATCTTGNVYISGVY